MVQVIYITSSQWLSDALIKIGSREHAAAPQRWWRTIWLTLLQCSLTCWEVYRKKICVVTKIIKTIWGKHSDTNVCQPLTSCFHSDKPSGNQPLSRVSIFECLLQMNAINVYWKNKGINNIFKKKWPLCILVDFQHTFRTFRITCC